MHDSLRIGTGFDVHAFAPERKLILGGIQVPSEKGLAGHSDADVLTHAVMDALLGAARLGDIGELFPDTSDTYKDADSIVLLQNVVAFLKQQGYAIIDVDVVVAAQKPKLAPYRNAMRERLAQAMEISVDNVGIKATTTEHLGFVGRCEGIAAWSCALLERCSCSSLS